MTRSRLAAMGPLVTLIMSIYAFFFWNNWVVVPVLHLEEINCWQALAIGFLTAPPTYKFVVIVRDDVDND